MSKRTAQYDALLKDHAATIGVDVEELRSFHDTIATDAPMSKLILENSITPARGYALIFKLTGSNIGARVHMLDGQADSTYTALFSRIAAFAEAMAPGVEGVQIDSDVTSDQVREAINTLGARYGLIPSGATEASPAAVPTSEDATGTGTTVTEQVTPEPDTPQEDATVAEEQSVEDDAQEKPQRRSRKPKKSDQPEDATPPTE